MGAQELFCSSFGELFTPYLTNCVSVFFRVCQKSEVEKKGKGVDGFCLTGFERKYLTKGSFVCFQMIDLGICATPLAVQG